MNKKINYSDEPLEIKPIKDFLPRPEELILREKTERITLNVTSRSKDFFMNLAKNANNTKVGYQTFMRDVLDAYAQKYLNH